MGTLNPMFKEKLDELLALADELPATQSNTYCIEQMHVRIFTYKLAHKGWKKLGSGFFSSVYLHIDFPDLAVKVGFKKEDSGAAYAAFCRENEGLTGLPVIHFAKRLNNCYVLVLDKLEEAEEVVTNYQDKYDVKLGIQYKALLEIINDGNNVNCSFAVNCLPSSEYEHFKSLIRTAQRIRNFFEGIAEFDLHDGNVMIDKDNHLVITDPVSYSKKESNALDSFSTKEIKDANCNGVIVDEFRASNLGNITPARVDAHFALIRKEIGIYSAANLVHSMDAHFAANYCIGEKK